MTTIRVDAPAFRDLCLAAARAFEEAITDVEIDKVTLENLHAIVDEWHPEESVRMHFADTYREVIRD